MIDMIVSGIIYVVLVYIVVALLKKRNKNLGNDDDGDGGISISTPPHIDLPPGVCWPDDGLPRGKREDADVLY